MKRNTVVVNGMTCSACSSTVEKYVRKQKGVIGASVNLVLGTLNVVYDDSINLNDIKGFIEKSGYKYGGIFDPDKDVRKRKSEIKNIKFFGILLVIILYLSMGSMIGLPSISSKLILNIILFIFSLVYIYYGKNIIIIGFKSLLIREPNMYSLVFVGSISNFIYSFINLITHNYMNIYFESICTIIYFVKLGEFIESRSVDSSLDAIREMVTMTPSKAHIIKKGKMHDTTIDNINKDDLLYCYKGERFPVDGVISKGSSYSDNSFITGEAEPVKIKKGDNVYASSINLSENVEFTATDIGPKSTISEIIHMVIDSSNNKTEVEKKSDIVSSYFTKIVLLISIITFVISFIVTKNINTSLAHFVSVLVVSCPCTLGLAAPLALLNARNLAFKNNILLRDNTPLILSSKIDAAIFDKTGTLTEGKPKLIKINNYSSISSENILEIVSSLEHLSNHPIARVFDKYKYVKVKDYKTHSNGIEGYVIGKYKYYVGNYDFISKYTKEKKDKDASFYLVSNGKIIASFYVDDEIRKDAYKTIEGLKNNHIKTVMLSGDKKESAKNISSLLDIDDVHAELTPKEKLEFIKKINCNTMMVGDGINDAPSLKEASVGVSLKGSTSIATNSANVILLDNNLKKILKLINISSRTIKIINENLIWAFIYNIFMIPIACGLTQIKLSPMIASISMCLSSLCVILNSLRLRKE